MASSKELHEFKDENVYVSLKMDQTVYYAYEQFEQKDIKLGIVVNDGGKANYFITTADTRRVMAQLK